MKTLVKLILLAGFAISQPALAECVRMTQDQVNTENAKGFPSSQHWFFNINFPASSVSIEPSLPIGGVITTAFSTALTGQYINFAACSGTGVVSLLPMGAATSIANVFKTNIPGIGFRISYVRVNGVASLFPVSVTYHSDPGQITYARFNGGAFFKIDLVKTGDIGSNNLVNLGQVGTGIAAGDSAQVITFTGGSTQVKVLPHCFVKSSKPNIDFGTFGAKDVSTQSGPTQPVEFTVQCTGPTIPGAITASLSAMPDPENTSLIKNNGAKHLAIRLSDPVTQTVLRPNDPGSTLAQKPDAQHESPFKLDATVLRVGTAPPTAGLIQATATITMTLR